MTLLKPLEELIFGTVFIVESIMLYPCSDLFNFDAVDADGYSSFGGVKGRSQPKKDPPIERDLALTLEEVYNGCIKKMKISRKVCCTWGTIGHT